MREGVPSRFLIPFLFINHAKHQPLSCTGDAGFFQLLRLPCLNLQDSAF